MAITCVLTRAYWFNGQWRTGHPQAPLTNLSSIISTEGILLLVAPRIVEIRLVLARAYFPDPYFIDWSYVGPYENTSDSTEIVTTYRPEGGARALSIVVPHLAIGSQHVYEIKLVTGLREVSLGKTNPATCISLSKILGTRVSDSIIYNTFTDLSKAEVRIQTILGVTHYAIEVAFDDSRLPNGIQKKWIFPANSLQVIPIPSDVSNPIRQSLASLDLSDLYSGGQSLGFRVSVGVVNQNDGQRPLIVSNSHNNSPYYNLQETPFLFSESTRIDYVPLDKQPK
jgi:hypothetical protein